MTELSACYGCFVKTSFDVLPNDFEFNHNLLKNSFDSSFTNSFEEPSLRDKEELILTYLAKAWEEFSNLENKHPMDDNEFCTAIHDAQKMIALRVARRANPEIWKQFTKEGTENVS